MEENEYQEGKERRYKLWKELQDIRAHYGKYFNTFFYRRRDKPGSNLETVIISIL